jgi:hypothetical protein
LTHSFQLEADDLTLQHWKFLDRRHPGRLEDHAAAARLLGDITAAFLGACGGDDAIVSAEAAGPTLLEVSAPTAERLAYARDHLFSPDLPPGVAGVADLVMGPEELGGIDWHSEMSARDTERWNLLKAARD